MAITPSSSRFHYLDQQLIDIAFVEDFGSPFHDSTISLLFPEMNKSRSNARIISKHSESIVICGLPIVKVILDKLSNQCDVTSTYQDGDLIPSGSTILTIDGPAPVLLMAERILLNFLQPLSAIATLTNRYVNKLSHTKTQILDTRKTLPGFRHLAKYAVQCGGGVNHRMGLYDAVMIKDTHIDLLGGIKKTLDKIPNHVKEKLPVIVEVRNKEELAIILEYGHQKLTRVLLDNMSINLMRECVLMCQNVIPTEASGNITLENAAEAAETGIDFISIGSLTHSAGNIDLSMKCDIQNA